MSLDAAMDFQNDTPFPAILPTTILDEDRMAASLVARVTYALDLSRKDDRLRIAPEPAWEVSHEPIDTPHGKLEAETPFMKGGVDLFVFGAARSLDREPVTRMEVRVSVGDFVRRAVVTGNRIWLKSAASGIHVSAPAKFVEMPLVPANAFGGEGAWDGLAIPWAENPGGKGFVVAADQAEGTPLPNLEEPDARVTAWDDRPPVCGFGFCPQKSRARFREGLVFQGRALADITPRWFNTAFPPMVAPRAAPGDRVELTGFTHDGSLGFELPAPPFDLHLRFGDKEATRTPVVDSLGVEVDDKRVVVTYRFAFRYVVRARELRHAMLVPRKN